MDNVAVLVSDSFKLYAESLALALYWQPQLAIAQQHPTTGQEVLEAVVEEKPDVLLLDFWLPDMSGPAAVAEVLRAHPRCKVLVLSWIHNREHVAASLDAGAVGFLPRSMSVGELAEAIRRAMDGESPVFGEKLAGMLDTMNKRSRQVEEIRDRLMVLTPRELELLRRLNLGRSTPEIAKELSIAQATVRDHFHNIVTKTGARTKEQALAMAKYCGLIR